MTKQTNELEEENKNKCRGSCIQLNRFLSLIKDIVASIIIPLAITFKNGDPYRSNRPGLRWVFPLFICIVYLYCKMAPRKQAMRYVLGWILRTVLVSLE